MYRGLCQAFQDRVSLVPFLVFRDQVSLALFPVSLVPFLANQDQVYLVLSLAYLG